MSFISIIFSGWSLIVTCIFIAIYKWTTATHTFFENKGIASKTPIPLFGNFFGIIFHTESLHDFVIKSYQRFKHKKFFGLYELRNKLLVINDPELIKQITVKDFDHFLDHRQLLVNEPLFGKSLFALRGQKWRDMRATLSPAFTGSKMRLMFQLVVECGEITCNHLLKKSSKSEPLVIDMKDLFTRYANDVIATSAFGIQVNSLENPENEFYSMGKTITNFGPMSLLKMLFIGMMPKVAKFLNMNLFGPKVIQFYQSLVHDTMKYRQKEGIFRPDMINLLMQAKQGSLNTSEKDDEKDGFATVEDINNAQLKAKTIIWEDDDLTAQCMLFLLAGFETSATLMCFAAHELAENQDVQKLLIQEIDEVNSNLEGKLTYEIIQKMKYLDMVVSETLRKWPPAIATDRLCIKPYVIEDENGVKITIDKGEVIWIPVIGLHRDSEYYPNPDNFDPERFNEENSKNIPPFTYLPFGSGPRNCIGSRFALMECKGILFHLLSKFTFEISAKTQVPLKMAKSGFAVKAEKGFYIHLKPRNL